MSLDGPDRGRGQGLAVAEANRGVSRRSREGEQVYAVAILAMKDPELNRIHRPAHLEYLAGLKAEGKVWVSGPFADGQGGMVIYEAPSLEAAAALAAADPLVRTGARSLSLHPWEPTPPVRAIDAPKG